MEWRFKVYFCLASRLDWQLSVSNLSTTKWVAFASDTKLRTIFSGNLAADIPDSYCSVYDDDILPLHCNFALLILDILAKPLVLSTCPSFNACRMRLWCTPKDFYHRRCMQLSGCACSCNSRVTVAMARYLYATACG